MNESIKLTNHFWEKDVRVHQYIDKLVDGKKLIVDVGCGKNYFHKAHELIDHNYVETDKIFHQLDITVDKLPYENKQVDFLYCKHTLEDIENPRWLLSEINRVAKAGYIETPSPLIEITRGADAGWQPWRGYYHHRSIIWSDGKKLTLVPKYPVIELLNFPDIDIAKILSESVNFWNTYYFWENDLNYEFPFIFGYGSENYNEVIDYGNLLIDGTKTCIHYNQELLAKLIM